MNAASTERGRAREPQRTCVGCHQTVDQSRLVRLVRSPDGEVVVDHPRRLGGRGAYVCSTLSCVTQAAGSKRLGLLVGGRAAKVSSASLRRQIAESISRRVVGLLAAAGRGRKVAIGVAKTTAALSDGAELVVVARDASARVVRDLESAALECGVAVMEFGDRSELGLAFAREVVAAVALTDEGLARAVCHELELLRGLSEAQETMKRLSQRERLALERAT